MAEGSWGSTHEECKVWTGLETRFQTEVNKIENCLFPTLVVCSFYFPKEWIPKNLSTNGAARIGIYWTVWWVRRWKWNESSTQASIIIIIPNKRRGVNVRSNQTCIEWSCSSLWKYWSTGSSVESLFQEVEVNTMQYLLKIYYMVKISFVFSPSLQSVTTFKGPLSTGYLRWFRSIALRILTAHHFLRD